MTIIITIISIFITLPPPSVFEGFLLILNSQIKSKKLFIIYNNPVCGQLLIEDGFKLINIYPDMWGNGINIYKKYYQSIS